MKEADPKKLRRTILAGISGNVMEWYDFAVYGYLAAILGTQFFPSEDPLVSLISSYGAFAAGFVSRPLGGIVFGHIGDRIGRKSVLMVSVLMMGIATFVIGVLPGYAEIGVAAPILLIGMRILQGLSVGGEYSGSITFVAEHAPPARRGYLTSWIGMGAIFGFVLGAGAAALLEGILDDAQMQSWGWRLPFLVGIVIALGSFMLRRHVEEPPVEDDATVVEGLPFVAAFRVEWRGMLQVMGLALSVNVAFYLMFVYAATYLNEHMHVSSQATMDISTGCLLAMCVVVPISGWISDRWGRKPVALIGMISLFLLSYPLFWLMNHSDLTLVLLGQLGFAVILGWIFGVNPALQVEALSRSVRMSAFSMSYNITLALFGGTAPIVATYLVARTSDDFIPAYYVMVLALFSLVAVIMGRETKGEVLKP
ncbi:MAG: MFS transporter [Rhodospirillaceae bacterium]|nr:MFS transporter [Rhodospirillaceae bacterium]MBT6510907.1 MFS transporter [Rhodospirillaceae bacterium]MBT7614524.1 MFS transporter [Rhodospirillaceae bacterium]